MVEWGCQSLCIVYFLNRKEFPILIPGNHWRERLAGVGSGEPGRVHGALSRPSPLFCSYLVLPSDQIGTGPPHCPGCDGGVQTFSRKLASQDLGKHRNTFFGKGFIYLRRAEAKGEGEAISSRLCAVRGP